MTSTQQRAELQNQIWKIANEVRGSVDGWDFKQYAFSSDRKLSKINTNTENILIYFIF